MENPFRPGAGHQPPYLAGREEEKNTFAELLKQRIILKNLLISGLRGIGKTALLEELKHIAIKMGWKWTGTDCSEAVSTNEESMAIRLLTDLAIITSGIKINEQSVFEMGFISQKETSDVFLSYEILISVFQGTPGLVSDKLKTTLEFAWKFLSESGCPGMVFAYDEAQMLADHAERQQYPLSLLLDVFQSTQKKGIPFMLILTGLPTLLSNLVSTRTYSERLFRVLTLERLNDEDSREAILKPITKDQLVFTEDSVKTIIKESGGYPYFIQFICKEVYDIWLQKLSNNQPPAVPIQTIIKKLDNDFFAGRWDRTTDRERDLLRVIATKCGPEFSIQDIVEALKSLTIKPFSRSHINQMLKQLTETGLIYKNKRAVYSFAVPLLADFIVRQE